MNDGCSFHLIISSSLTSSISSSMTKSNTQKFSKCFCVSVGAVFVLVIHTIYTDLPQLQALSCQSLFESESIKKKKKKPSQSRHNFIGLHNLPISDERLPSSISEDDWLLQKTFSEIEDGDRLLEWSERNPDYANRMAIVLSIFNGYDRGPPNLNQTEIFHNDNVDFVFFSDSYDYEVPEGWIHVVNSTYHDLDTHSDLGLKNSLSNPNLSPNKRANMNCKYYLFMFWRLPQLRRYRYIAYMDGNINFFSTTNYFYDMTKRIIGDNSMHAVMTQHQSSRTILEEVRLANGQPRYGEDRVTEQGTFYWDNFRYKELELGHHRVYWIGVHIHDNFNSAHRQLLFDVYGETQLWTLEDQVAYPFVEWYHSLTNKTESYAASEFCEIWMGVADGKPCAFKHAIPASSYGQS